MGLVGLLTIAYFASALAGSIAEIMLSNKAALKSNSDTLATLASFRLPNFVIDLLFLGWILVALNSTISLLSHLAERAKLDMYRNLRIAIVSFITLVGLLSFALTMSSVGVYEWPWQLAWLNDVLWEALNLGVLMAVCIICRPTASSHLLLYSSQLPTDENDAESLKERSNQLDQGSESDSDSSSSSGSEARIEDPRLPSGERLRKEREYRATQGKLSKLEEEVEFQRTLEMQSFESHDPYSLPDAQSESEADYV
jgi:hypothetical protein